MRLAPARKAGSTALMAAALVAGMAGTAAAQIPTGMYLSAGIGANFATDSSVEPRGALRTGTNGGGTLSLNNQAMGLPALGYGFGNGVRVELETSLRGNQVDGVSGFPGLSPITGRQGQLWNLGLMGNALLELNVGSPYVQPYVGFGLGYAWTELKDMRVVGNGQRLEGDGTDGNFAYQFIAGAAFPIASVPGLAATLEYRYFATLDPDISGRIVATGPNTAQSGRMDISNQHHSVLVGLRYALGAQPAPVPALVVPPMMSPPVAAAPAPTRSFIVFFDNNSYALSARARAIVAEAAQAARTGGTTRIEVTGHTDRRGTVAVNQRLSLRRAEIVAAELRRLGIRRDEITTRGAGESEPLVPTADQVREPQNRRVEIVLR